MNITIKNCNNIREADISIERNALNIKYGMNGTGKSTIAKAIEMRENLEDLKTFGSELEPEIIISENISNVEVFNNDFINRITFNGSEVIDNAFEVFVKTDEYDQKRKQINEILNKLNRETFKDEKIGFLRNSFNDILQKIQLNADQTIRRSATYKSIIKKENMFEIPDQLQKYGVFIKDKKNNISWVEWKNKGYEFDDKNKCPFCTDELPHDYESEKKVFIDNYTKAGMKNLNEIYDLIEGLKEYLNNEKYEKLISCIKEEKSEDEIGLIFQKFILEIIYLKNKFDKIYEFDSYNIKNSEISNLAEIVKGLIIDSGELDYLNNDKTIEVIGGITNKINEIVNEIAVLQQKTAILNGFINNAIKKSVNDINKFLETAGFNYKFDFSVLSEESSKTVLLYKGEADINVENIEKHLSWGERNAFALVLFMYYAISKKADIIILDDPISSFDSNKKYAIINRLFENRPDRKSLYGKTVIMLTHDFEPIIDFVINDKDNSKNVVAKYIKNSRNNIIETEIKRKDDIVSIVKMAYMYATNPKINMISRINFLRKYIEHTSVDSSKNQLIYDMLSSLIHAKEIPDKQIDRETTINFTEEEINDAENGIREFIEGFEYKKVLESYFNKKYILEEYFKESNNYIKSQLFRVYIDITDNTKGLDDNLLKFINEIYHIENDYIFTIDLIKFDTIPDYIMDKINGYMLINNQSQ